MESSWADTEKPRGCCSATGASRDPPQRERQHCGSPRDKHVAFQRFLGFLNPSRAAPPWFPWVIKCAFTPYSRGPNFVWQRTREASWQGERPWANRTMLVHGRKSARAVALE